MRIVSDRTLALPIFWTSISEKSNKNKNKDQTRVLRRIQWFQLEHFRTSIAPRGEAELRHTFWLVRWDQKSWKTFETLIGDVIDTSRKTKPAVNQTFVPKSRILTSSYHSASYSNIYTVNRVFSSNAIMHCNVWKISAVNNAKMNSWTLTLSRIENVDMSNMIF